jgi:hypothetical protein
MFLFLLHMYLEMELSNHMVILIFNHLKTVRLFLKQLCHITSCPVVYKNSCFFTFSPNAYYLADVIQIFMSFKELIITFMYIEFLWYFNIILFFFSRFWDKHRASCMLSKHSATELHLQSYYSFVVCGPM